MRAPRLLFVCAALAAPLSRGAVAQDAGQQVPYPQAQPPQGQGQYPQQYPYPQAQPPQGQGQPPASIAAPQQSPQPAPADAQAAGVPSGQWVYTQQYGWIWMPHSEAYTYVPSDGSGQPYQYVYATNVGWTWVAAPWVWGYGPWPYFGVAGAWGYPWYGWSVGIGVGFYYGYGYPHYYGYGHPYYARYGYGYGRPIPPFRPAGRAGVPVTGGMHGGFSGAGHAAPHGGGFAPHGRAR